MDFNLWALRGNRNRVSFENYEIVTGDTVSLLLQIQAFDLVMSPLPHISLVIKNSRNFLVADTLIGPSDFTVNFDRGINVLEGTLTLSSDDTAAIALPNIDKHGRPYQDAFWEVQFVQDDPKIVRTWPRGDSGKLKFVGDLNRVNS